MQVHGNINGGTRSRNAAASMDFYRRVPKEFTEATSLGALMSLCAMGIMAILFFAESFAFLRTNIITKIALDNNAASQIQLNFNITLFDLPCDYVSIDVWDVLGTNKQNVTKNIDKWQLDQDGKRAVFAGRNREERVVKHEEHRETLAELHENGVHAVELDESEFKPYMESHDLVFVNFYAPWCIWCKKLHPTWEKFAEEVEEHEIPVGVANVNCEENRLLCMQENVQAFPSIKWYEEGQFKLNYMSDRTVAALVGYARLKVQTNNKYKEWEEKGGSEAKRAETQRSLQTNLPGCQVSGTLMVNRVPGNFHIEAKSKNHNINALMANLTHRVNHLSFGDQGANPSRVVKRVLKQVPKALQQFAPIDDTSYVTSSYHQAYHHHIKVVSTHFKIGVSDVPTLYQYLEQSQIVYYDNVNVPEARFSYDLSPMSVVVEKEGRRWYDYLTSLSAIIGGTFTTLGLVDAVLYKVLKPKKL